MANSLPFFQTGDRTLSLLQSAWAKIINPLLRNPSLDSLILSEISLAAGDNTVNHLLGRKLQGWRIVRLRSNASVYDKQDNNVRPELTLILNSSAACVADIEVF